MLEQLAEYGTFGLVVSYIIIGCLGLMMVAVAVFVVSIVLKLIFEW